MPNETPNFFQSDLFQNAVPVVVLAGLVWALVAAGRTPLWSEAYRRLLRRPLAVFALVVIGLYGTVALLDSFGATDPKSQTRKTVLDRLFERPKERTYSAPMADMTFGEPEPQKLKEPGTHLLGTDGVGNDILYRTLKGVKTALTIGGATSLMVTPIALLLGMMAGYYGKTIDDIIQYVYTVLSSIPGILLQIALVLVLGKGLPQICIALGITRWVGLCRLTRGETLKHRDREYVRGAKALGVSDFRLLTRHILPNLLPVVIISVTLGFSGLVLSESTLTYLGIGVDADTGSWGNMIDAARDELARDPIIWWNLTSATSALFLLVLAFNLLGDALRDAIDPRLRS
ncbi:MAG: ABC transporter permease [Capsulimonadales bacterium]|nr:ABC transporter permease [Capsulimonadales bacterium]